MSRKCRAGSYVAHLKLEQLTSVAGDPGVAAALKTLRISGFQVPARCFHGSVSERHRGQLTQTSSTLNIVYTL
jgi:hypothetical protein